MRRLAVLALARATAAARLLRIAAPTTVGLPLDQPAVPSLTSATPTTATAADGAFTDTESANDLVDSPAALPAAAGNLDAELEDAVAKLSASTAVLVSPGVLPVQPAAAHRFLSQVPVAAPGAPAAPVGEVPPLPGPAAAADAVPTGTAPPPSAPPAAANVDQLPAAAYPAIQPMDLAPEDAFPLSPGPEAERRVRSLDAMAAAPTAGGASQPPEPAAGQSADEAIVSAAVVAWADKFAERAVHSTVTAVNEVVKKVAEARAKTAVEAEFNRLYPGLTSPPAASSSS